MNNKKKIKKYKNTEKSNLQKIVIKKVELNNKIRKGTYVSVYDQKTKKTRYYKYLPKTRITDYKAIYLGNKEYNTKFSAKKILDKKNRLHLKKGETTENIIKKQAINKIKSKQKYNVKDIKEIIKHYNNLKKNSLTYNEIYKRISDRTKQFEHKFSYQKNQSIDQELTNFYNKGTNNAQIAKLLTQNPGSLSQFMSIELEIIGINNIIPERGKTQLATVFLHNQQPSKLIQILNNNELDEIYSDPDPLLEELKMQLNAQVQKIGTGKITNINIKLDMRFGNKKPNVQQKII